MGIFKGRSLFRVRGGIHPEPRKHLSENQPIRDIPLPPLLHIPLQQHIGAPAEALVQRGEQVLAGQILASSQGVISAPVHAPTSGRIVGVGNYPAHHPSGLLVHTVTLQPDGLHTPMPATGCPEPFMLSPDEITEGVKAAGIVGLGGAGFPSAVKLDLRKRYPVDTLVINGAECEPYLTCDDRIMQEMPQQVVTGILLMARALTVKRIIIAIEQNKPKAIQAMRDACEALSPGDQRIRVQGLPTAYPMGAQKTLVQALTGKETPARALTAEMGIVVHNVATALAVHDAVCLGQPLISRIVTVSGAAVREPANLRVPLGTPLSWLIEQCGGLTETPAQIISGGPMMGQPMPELRIPTVKGGNGLLALTTAEINARQPDPCIRCAACVSACPCGLVPVEMAALIRAGRFDDAVAMGLKDCIACGSCSWACPSARPLVQWFNHAKGELTERERTKHKQGETKRLAAARTERLEAAKRAKKEAMKKRKKPAKAKA